MDFNKNFTMQQIKKTGSSIQKIYQKSNSLLVNSELQLNQSFTSQASDEVLKKVSEIIVALHSSLVPKTENIQIYRDLTASEQKLMNIVGKNNILHPILAGVLAIDSCLKAIQKQQNYLTNNLMKGITICLGNYKKANAQFLQLNDGKVSQNFAKFYDSLKYIVNQIHKLPNAKIKKSEIDKHNEFLISDQLSQSLKQLQSREQSIILSLFEQQNRQMSKKIKYLQEKNRQLIMYVQKFQELQNSGDRSNQKIKRVNSDKDLNTQVGSSNQTTHQKQRQIMLLKEQINQKSDIILKMNEQFSAQIQKYRVVFKRLEQQNKILKKYNDLDTFYILEELEFQVNRLREQKRNDQNIIAQIQSKIDYMSWNSNNNMHGNNFSSNSFSNTGQFDNIRSKIPKNSKYPNYQNPHVVQEEIPYQINYLKNMRNQQRPRIPSRNYSPQTLNRRNQSPKINAFYSPDIYERQDFRDKQQLNQNYSPYQSNNPNRFINRDMRNYLNLKILQQGKHPEFKLDNRNISRSKERENSPNFGRKSREVFTKENNHKTRKFEYQQPKFSQTQYLQPTHIHPGTYQEQLTQDSKFYNEESKNYNLDRRQYKNKIQRVEKYLQPSQFYQQRQKRMSSYINSNEMRKSKLLQQQKQRQEEQF